LYTIFAAKYDNERIDWITGKMYRKTTRYKKSDICIATVTHLL